MDPLKRLGELLIAFRLPVLIVVSLLTGFFAYHASQLKLVTSFADLLPQDHPYIQIHNRFSSSFGGANNIMIMLEVRDGTVFTPETLNKIWRMTQAVDKLYGVNHNQIESIAHRTVRYLKVAAGGTMRAQPVMLGEVKTPEEAAAIRRIVHNAENIYGLLISLDDKAALIRANFIEGQLDYRRIFEEMNATVIEPFEDANTTIYAAGEPRLYGWVYRYAGEIKYIFIATTLVLWVLLYLYFRDWRGALRPTISGVFSAIWGLGFMHLIGFSLDPLVLVIPFFITARAVSHSVQMHDRYYETYGRTGDKHEAIIDAFAELFVPTFSGILTDAFGVLVILLVPIVLLQKLAIGAWFWIMTIIVAELLLNPIIYHYLAPPRLDIIHARERGRFKRVIDASVTAVLSPAGRKATYAITALTIVVSAYFWRSLIIGDPTSASPILRADAPYNVSHERIQQKFGGVEPLIVVAEGYDRDAMKDPRILRRMEEFQRALERDPGVGYSFSLADIIRAVNMVFHELEPKWGVIPDSWVDVGGLFFIYFSGAPPTETAKYVDPSYTTAHVTFFCKDHKGDNIRRIVSRAKQFIYGAQMKDLGLDLEERDGRVVVRAVGDAPNWERAGPSWVESTRETPDGPFRIGDVVLQLGKYPVTDLASWQAALQKETANKTLVDVRLQRDGAVVEETISVPWKAAFKLAGGLIGVLAAANEELLRNDLLMNLLGFGTIYLVLLFTYRSFVAGIYMLIPLVVANGIVNAYMGARSIGININTLPVVTVGVGFGIDYALYIVSRVIEEYKRKPDWEHAVHQACVTSGKAVTFTAASMIAGTLFWIFSRIRFDSEMGLLLALWMGISFIGSMTLLPVSLLTFRPRFVVLEAERIAREEARRKRALERLQQRRSEAEAASGGR
ncbi:MAG: RND family transporter [Candidatus Binatia bacterium]